MRCRARVRRVFASKLMPPTFVPFVWMPGVLLPHAFPKSLGALCLSFSSRMKTFSAFDGLVFTRWRPDTSDPGGFSLVFVGQDRALWLDPACIPWCSFFLIYAGDRPLARPHSIEREQFHVKPSASSPPAHSCPFAGPYCAMPRDVHTIHRC